jgi:enoyl-CoA hydratase/carnithine racemase
MPALLFHAIPMAPEGTPTLQIDGPVATITLRRPSQRNSLTDDDLHTLLAHCAQLDADTRVRLVVLTADTAGHERPVFSAGYHMSGFGGHGGGPGLFERVPDAFEALRPVSICALNGSVHGGATDLVLACDLRIALAGSQWRMPAAAFGLHYYASGLRRYVTRLGVDGAKRAFLTAQTLSVEQLAGLGLFDAVVGADRFDAARDELVQRVAALAPLAVQATKRSLNEIAAGLFDEVRLREREALTHASADLAEGLAAAAEKRPPRFEGR